MEGSNGWDQYKKLVISELERTNKRLTIMDKRLSHIEKNIIILQTKAATWAASVSVIISIGAGLLFKIL
jgi:hypothetical protein